MAMTIMNNSAAMMSLGELNKNTNKLEKSLKKVSSGMRINSAQDDAASYAISERMRVRLRGLEQDILNVKTGNSLLNVASGGIDNIVEELRNLKELALKAANDTNTDADRATAQKEFQQRIENIDDIATTTNYNGKPLLDGHYNRPNGYVIASAAEPTGTPITISSGNYTISSDGVYVLSNGYTGTITIGNNAKNVEIRQANPSVALNNAFIVGPEAGGMNLWIDQLNIVGEGDRSIIRFQGEGNSLTIKGENNITSARDENARFGTAAIISIGGGLTIGEDASGGILNVNLKSVLGNLLLPQHRVAGIGSDADDTDHLDADLVINGGTINVVLEDSEGACIGSSAGEVASQPSGMHDIIINGGNINVKQWTAWQTGRAGLNYEPDAISISAGAGIGSGYSSGVHDIIINGGNIVAQTENGAGIGTGVQATAHDILISKSARIDAYANHSVEALARTGGKKPSFAEDIGEGVMGTLSGIMSMLPGRGEPLVIQHGTKANQAIHCYINDMHTDVLGLGGINGKHGASVVNREKATATISIVDSALEYALNEATYVGAYISRLEHTEANLVTANENTQSAESIIRDADMAKEMMEYTKQNILSQASSSMLAQANQNAGSVLSLLQ